MDKFSPQTAEQYGRHYSEGDFWTKVRRVAAQAGAKVLYPAMQLYYLMQSPQVPLRVKTLIVGALGYLILPADLVPDFIPLLGFTDDLTAIMIALREARKYLTPEINRQAQEQTERLVGRTSS